MLGVLAGALLGQAPKPAQPPPDKQVEPPEEDEALTRKTGEYEFNPLQAAKEVRVGGFYMKKGSFKAAALRFLEATLWDPTSAEAFYRLGEARDRMGDRKGRAEAWEKFVELAPEDKRVTEVRKKLGSR
jgi:tetratricopeptide (TPR) repeat protein